jgi:hypothetical protein
MVDIVRIGSIVVQMSAFEYIVYTGAPLTGHLNVTYHSNDFFDMAVAAH